MTARAPLLLALAAMASGCGSTPTTPPSPTSLSVATQPSSTAGSGRPFAQQPVVQVLDGQGNPVTARGVLVTAAIASGGGTLAGETAIRTDAAGKAAFTDLALAGTVGPRVLRFTASGLQPAVSSEIALAPGDPATITPSAGNNQTAAAGTAVPVPPAVLIVDGAGNPIPGVAVAFAVESGAGTVAGAGATTGANGVATVGEWRLGTTIGPNTLRATAASLSFDFVATGIVGPPAKLIITAGDGQSATIGALLPVAPAVKVTDAFDNPITGLSVTFAVGTGGGTVTGGAVISDGSGLATVGGWTLGLAPGTQTLIASRPGGPSATFTAAAADFQVGGIAAGGFSSCALVSGTPYCWGFNGNGQLGTGDTATQSAPVALGAGGAFTSLDIGAGHACAIGPSGLLCWGADGSGQLGDGSTTDRPLPGPVIGGAAFTQVSVGDVHTCALDASGAAWCWGNNGGGRLGDGTTTSRSQPTPVAGGNAFTMISAGGAHTCGLRTDGQVLCWGFNNAGQIGDSTTQSRSTPTPVKSSITFTAVSAGGSHTCALDAGGNAYCWGLGTLGALGSGLNASQTGPGPVSGGLTFATIAAGGNHTCGLSRTLGTVYCWGANNNGQIGDASALNRPAPTAVAGNPTATALDLGQEHSCIRTMAGSAVCWGRGSEGQLGDGASVLRRTPVGAVSP